jgi:hypothetical protein
MEDKLLGEDIVGLREVASEGDDPATSNSDMGTVSGADTLPVDSMTCTEESTLTGDPEESLLTCGICPTTFAGVEA